MFIIRGYIIISFHPRLLWGEDINFINYIFLTRQSYNLGKNILPTSKGSLSYVVVPLLRLQTHSLLEGISPLYCLIDLVGLLILFCSGSFQSRQWEIC